MTKDEKMCFKVKLDCELGNQREFARHQSALLAASMLFNAYIVSKENLFGIGPELFAEQWIYNYIVVLDENFNDLVMIYFVKILQGVQNGR